MGVKLGPQDVSFRMNLVCLSGALGQEVMADFAGGHIDSSAAAQLVAAMNEAVGDETFQFYPGVSYRHLLVWRGGMQAMTCTPPHDISDKSIAGYWPKGEGAEELVRIMRVSREVMAKHPLNKERAAHGHLPISQVWLWGQGKAPTIPSFKSRYGLNGSCITEGRIRYVQVRRFRWRGAVNGVPESCSVYSPSGAFCGEFWPCGSAPASASVANSLPNPVMYLSGILTPPTSSSGGWMTAYAVQAAYDNRGLRSFCRACAMERRAFAG